jgi:peptide/nickel transport system substrate-binding protein
MTNDALLKPILVGGTQVLVPDLAVEEPTNSSGVSTYTFRLRPGIHYSNGRLVQAEDFRRAVERLLRVGSPWSGNYLSIVGASTCTKTRCDLNRGIVVDNATRAVTFHLRSADPYFLGNMTSMATSPVPRGVPFHDVGSTPIPGTGPYVVASSSKHEIRYVRNPYFQEWSHAAQPDGFPDVIVMRYGLTPSQEVRAVERGQADWTADGVPASLLKEVTTRFPAQAHPLLTTETDFLLLNNTIPPFNDERVRRALNLAIDRAAIVRLYGGPSAASPTCQLLPPGILGYRRYCPYTLHPGPDGRWRAPDLAAARRLVAASDTRGEQVTVAGASDGGVIGPPVADYTVRVLRQLGYRARMGLHPGSYFAHAPQSVFRAMQLGTDANEATAPYFFVGGPFVCAPPTEFHFFCDPSVDRGAHRAQQLEATDTRASSLAWTRLDHRLVDEAAWVPLVNPHFIDFFSVHVHNYVADPTLGLIADQVSLR